MLGCRIIHHIICEGVMGTGVGEAMLISAATGAAMGGAGAALSGEDPLQGALMGGVMGGAAGGIGGALGGVPAGAGAGASSAAPGAINAAASMPALEGAALSPGLASGATSAMPVAQQSMGAPAMRFADVFSPEAGSAAADMGVGERLGNYMVQNPMQTGAGAAFLGSALKGPSGPDEDDDEYDGPLSHFKYSPANFRPSFAEGGLAATPEGQQFLDPRLIEGPGDGMSDDVPAMIDGAQPAALADGEFVIPADVVSGLGNGSTDAGARQLYELVDRVRRARTGSTKQGAEIDPEEHIGFAKGGSVAIMDDGEAVRGGRPVIGAGGIEFFNPNAGADNSGIAGLASGYTGASAPQNIQSMMAALRQSPEYARQVEYTKSVRPGYQEFGPNGQFYQPVYRPEYTDYRDPQGGAG